MLARSTPLAPGGRADLGEEHVDEQHAAVADQQVGRLDVAVGQPGVPQLADDAKAVVDHLVVDLGLAQLGRAGEELGDQQAVRPEFRLTTQNAPAVAEIAARLDGLPLAIELAATRTKILAPEQILPRLQRRLTLLTTGARTLPDRQRTLRGAIAWSHDLLPDPERRLFARLSVFAGGWTLESAEAVCGPGELGLDVLDGLTSLVDQSLVLRTEPTAGHPRFSMLETIREFGQERLAEDGDLEQVRRRHAEHFLDLALAAEPHLTGADQGEWLDCCDLEQANLRAALRWAADGGQADRAQEAAGRCGGFGSSAGT
jgi:predicted ATPase